MAPTEIRTVLSFVNFVSFREHKIPYIEYKEAFPGFMFPVLSRTVLNAIKLKCCGLLPIVWVASRVYTAWVQASELL
jgi:hypothetical protein